MTRCEMRLIDADAIRYDRLLKTGNKEHPLEWAVSQSAINYMPTVFPHVQHVESVGKDGSALKRGHWIEHEFGLMCSECGHYTEAMYDEPFNNEFGKGWAYIRPYYCGYCGVKMDEVEDV